MVSVMSHNAATRQSDRGMAGRMPPLLLSPMARPLRALSTGGFAALIQLGVLAVLDHQHWAPVLANIVALLIGTQVNFVLSYHITWHDRRPPKGASHVVLRRWIAYQLSNAGAALL